MTVPPAPVTLRPLAPGDEEAAVRWAADDVFCAAVDWTPGLSPRVVRRHWQTIIAGGDPGFRRWGITSGGVLVGYVDLAGLTAHTAELGIAVGERALWGQGIGRRGCLLALAWAWVTGLDEVTAQVHEPNARSHALMRHLGFVEAGWADPEPYQGEVVRVRKYVLLRPG